MNGWCLKQYKEGAEVSLYGASGIALATCKRKPKCPQLKQHRPFMFSSCNKKFKNRQFKDVRVKVSAVQPSHNDCEMASAALNIWEGKGRGGRGWDKGQGSILAESNTLLRGFAAGSCQ